MKLIQDIYYNRCLEFSFKIKKIAAKNVKQYFILSITYIFSLVI